jgi:hypothetical protein
VAYATGSILAPASRAEEKSLPTSLFNSVKTEAIFPIAHRQMLSSAMSHFAAYQLAMDLQWIYNGFAMDLQWICNGLAMVNREFVSGPNSTVA